ncbi:MAG: hypothetical protein ACR2M0_09885 [Chloroflexia bacterium]
MTRLEEVLSAMGLQGEWSLGGRWLKIEGECCPVYVVESAWGAQYYTWCDTPAARAVETYPDPAEAIRAGLARSACDRLGMRREADA